jgi:hypothetical protein
MPNSFPLRFLRWDFLLVLLVAFSSGGCALIGLPAIATALGIASSAASIGGSVYSQGKLDSSEMSTMPNWTASVYAAADDLHLKIKKPADPAPASQPVATMTIVLEDDLGSTISLTAERRTQTLLHSRVDVGVFGSEPTARLLLQRIRHHAGVSLRDLYGPSGTDSRGE